MAFRYDIDLGFSRSNFENAVSFDRNFRKMSILVEISKNTAFGRKLGNLDFFFEISENRDFSRYFRKIPIVVGIFEKSLFWSKF